MIRFLLAFWLSVAGGAAFAQTPPIFAHGQLATAAQLNQAFASVMPKGGGTFTGPVALGSWTTANRPACAGTTYVGINLTTKALEYCNGSLWVTAGGGTAPTATLAAPTNVIIGTPTVNSLAVSWTPPPTTDLVTYQVQTAVCGATVFTNYGTPTTATQATITGLPSSTCEQVQIYATDGAQHSLSAAAQGTTLTAPPTAVVLGLGTVTDTTAQIIFQPPSSGYTFQAQYALGTSQAYTNTGSPVSPALPEASVTLTVTGLTAGTPYTFRLLETTAGGATPSSVVSATTAPAPVVVPPSAANLASTNISATGTTLSWTDSAAGTAPTFFEVDYQAQGAGTWTTAATQLSVESYVLGNLTASTPYNWRVIASNTAGAAAPATGSFTTIAGTSGPPAPPAAVTLGLGTVTATSVQLIWTTPATGYTFQPQYAAGASQAYVNIGSAISPSAAGSTTTTLTGLSAATPYTFRLVETTAGGTVPSSTVAATTSAPPPVVPSSPGTLNSLNITATSASLVWLVPASGSAPIFYEVDYQVQGASGWTTAATNLSTVTYVLTGLTPVTPYNWRVIASNTAGASAPSVESFTTISGQNTSTAVCTGTQTTAGGPPTMTGPASCTVTQGSSLAVPGLSISGTLTQCCGALDITTSQGSIAMTLAGAPVRGSGTVGAWTVNDTLANANSDLATATYTAPNTLTSDNIVLQWWQPDGSYSQNMTIPVTVVAASGGGTGGGGASGGGGGGGPPAGTVPTDATGTQAVRTQDVWKRWGIDLHIDGCCNVQGGGDYTNISGVISAINYIGNVGLLLDYWENDNQNTRGATISQQTGAQWITTISEGGSYTADLARMRSFEAACKCVWAYAGPNEPDSAYSASQGETPQNAAQWMETGSTTLTNGAVQSNPGGITLQGAAHADGVKAIQQSFMMTNSGGPPPLHNYDCCGVIANADYGNGHTYPQKAPSIYGDPNYQGMLDWIEAGAHYNTPGLPVAHTEYGWISGCGTGYGCDTNANIGKYSLEMIFDGFRHGDAAYMRYGLYDDIAGNFGMFDASNNPRPEATDMRNLSAILLDTSSNARSFTTGKLNVAFSKSPGFGGPTSLSGFQYLVMQKGSNGHFMIEMQNEQDLSGSTPANYNVTLTFGEAMTSVDEYDPTTGSTSTNICTSCSSATISLPPYPIIVEVTHP